VETIPTQAAVQLELQQVASAAQIWSTQLLQPVASAVPVAHALCAQVDVTVPHVESHTLSTSPTQVASQLVVQQAAFAAHTLATHGSAVLHAALSAAPVMHLL
jgi:hypothetical protein